MATKRNLGISLLNKPTTEIGYLLYFMFSCSLLLLAHATAWNNLYVVDLQCCIACSHFAQTCWEYVAVANNS